MNPLAKLSDATRLLGEVRNASEAKSLLDKASAAEHYAKKAKLGDEAISYAREIKIDAEVLLGKFLPQNRNRGAKGSKVTGGHRQPVKDDAPTLAELGLSKEESAQAQMLAEVAEAEPEKIQALKSGKITVKNLKREKKEKKRQARRKKNAELVAAVDDPKEIAAAGARFATIVIDPPWDWGDEGDVDQMGRAKPTYQTMGIEELTKLPVEKLADDDSHIYLWITNRSLPKGFALLEAWGFRYVTALTWPKPNFGMGNYFRGQTEHVLFGVRGSQGLKRKDASTLLPTWNRGPDGHSSKPVEFYSFVESCSPGPYLEMFARQQRKGWKRWGAEA